MKLSRSGAERSTPDKILIDDVKAEPRSFDQGKEAVVLRTLAARDRHNRSTYHYELSFTLEEVMSVVKLLATKMSAQDRAILAKHLAPHTGSLLRLTNLSAGVWV